VLTFTGLAVISVALQLADGCTRLYDFWGSIQEAPTEVKLIKEDLMLLSAVLTQISWVGQNSPPVVDALRHCSTRIDVSLEVQRHLYLKP